MRKFTFLFALFLMMVGTAMAETAPTTALTAEQINALSEYTPVAISAANNSTYGKWYDGSTHQTNFTVKTTFVIEPTGNSTFRIRKMAPSASVGEGYIQPGTNNVAFTYGSKKTAQEFIAVKPVAGGTGNTNFDTADKGGIADDNCVRFVCADNTNLWINTNGNKYHSTGIGTYATYEVRKVAVPTLSNNKVYTVTCSRSNLVANQGGTAMTTTAKAEQGLTFDATNNRFQFVFLKNAKGQYYMYNVNANKFVLPSGNLSDSPSLPVNFSYGNADGKFIIYFSDSKFINVGGSNQLSIDGWGPGGTNSYGSADDGNSFTINEVSDVAFSPSEELMNKTNQVTVTFNYKVGESLYLTKDKDLSLGTVLSATHFSDITDADYVTVESWDKMDAINDDCTVNVTCTAQTLPLVVSENFENAKWYMINMHSNENNYIWTATITDSNPALTVVNKGSVYKETTAPDDTRLWCFVGDVCGIKIYNKAVGSAYTMNKTSDGDNAISWGAAESGTLYQLQKTATSISNGFCFLPVGHSHYLNHRQPTIQGWNKRDEGSTCRAFAPDAFLLNYAADIPAGPANSLGTAKYFNAEGNFESFNNAIAAANANHFSAEATDNLAAILTDYASDGANATPNASTITDGGYYRLMNYNYKTYMTSGLSGTNNVLWGGLSAAEAPGTAGTIVKITADGSNYKMSTQGLEFGEVSKSTQVNLKGEGILTGKASFTITATNNLFVFKDVSTGVTSNLDLRCLHCDGSNKIVGWEAVANASKWYVIPATTLDLPLNTVEGKSYATTYLPFDVTLPADAKAYIVTVAEGDKATVSEVADIPAKQGVVLVSETAASTATLTLGTALANCTSNILSGTNPRITIAEGDKNNYYIFGNGGNGVGFYHPNNTTLKENRAYLPASAVLGGGMALALDFGGINTGIEAAIQTDEANAAYYDLSGRRVMRPTKGIYVKNGRKVYVK